MKSKNVSLKNKTMSDNSQDNSKNENEPQQQIKMSKVTGDKEFLKRKAAEGAIVLEQKMKRVKKMKSAECVRALIKILLKQVVEIRKANPEMSHDNIIKEIRKDDSMKDFYKTHPRIVERICDPEVTPTEIQEVFSLIHIRRQVEQGKISPEEAKFMSYQLASKNHVHQMNPEQIEEYKETGKIPDGLINEDRAARVARKLVPPKVLRDAIRKRESWIKEGEKLLKKNNKEKKEKEEK